MKRRRKSTSLEGSRISDRDEVLMEDTAVTPSPRRNVGEGKRMTRMARKTSRALNENRIAPNTLPNNEFSNRGTNAEEGDEHSALVTGASKETGIQDERKSTTYGKKIGELRKLTALVEGVIKDASTEQILEYSKKKPEGDLTEITTLRAKLDRAEAAIEVGKLDHSMAVADLQGKLLEREETLHRLEEESLQKDIQREKSKEEENRLREELKRAQEDVSFLSAWDEEKVELEAEVKRLKMKVYSATAEGKERLEEAHREFRIASVSEASSAQKQLASHRQKIRQDLERELSDEFRDRRRENEEFRREIEHQTQELQQHSVIIVERQMNCMMKELLRVKGALSTKRAELEDERRMHLLTIRGKKVAEALIAKLQTQLMDKKHSKPCFPQQQQHYSTRPGICSELDMTRENRNATRNRPAAPRTGRSACVVGPHQAGGSVSVDVGLSRANHDGTGGSDSRSSRTARADLGNMLELLAPACPEGISTLNDGETTAVAGGIEGANMPGASKDEHSSTGAAGGDGTCSMKDISNDNFANRTAGNKAPGISITSSVTAIPGSDNGRISRKDCEFFEMLPHSASEVTSADVWSQLDSYIHRRSEVARTNRHFRVIEAIHKPRMKLSSHATNAFESGSMSSTSVNLVDKETCVRKHGDCSTTVNGEVFSRASQERLDWQERNVDNVAIPKRVSGRVDGQSADGSCVRDHIRGDSSDSTERAPRSIVLGTMPKRRIRRGPCPPRGIRNASQLDGSVSTLSQGSALCNPSALCQGEEGQDRMGYTTGTTAVSRIEGDGTDREEFGTMAPRHWARRYDIIESIGPGRGELREPIRTIVVQKPHKSGSYPCIDLGESALPLSNTCSATGITKNASRTLTEMGNLKGASGAWRDKAIKPMLPLDKPCGNGEGRGNLLPKGSGWRMGGANKGGGLGAKRRTCRKIELAEWIQANTNLVNVACLENSGSSSPLDITGATVVPVKAKLPYFPPITHQM